MHVAPSLSERACPDVSGKGVNYAESGYAVQVSDTTMLKQATMYGKKI